MLRPFLCFFGLLLPPALREVQLFRLGCCRFNPYSELLRLELGVDNGLKEAEFKCDEDCYREDDTNSWARKLWLLGSLAMN